MAAPKAAEKAMWTFKYSTRHSVAFRPPVCYRCSRPFSTVGPLQAGHNKWSKTKHIKAVTDKKKNVERNQISNRIFAAVRMHGPDSKNNPSLANLISTAAKASIPKQIIEQAILRGQGKSLSGGTLEPCIIEALMPPDIAILVTTETDNKKRTRGDISYAVKKCEGHNGNTQFYFTKRGRAVLSTGDNKPEMTELMDAALELEGTEDVEEAGQGAEFIVWTEPTSLVAVATALADKFGLEVVESDIVWDANEETKVDIDSSESVEALDKLFAWLKEYPEVKTIYANVKKGGNISEDEWDKIESHLHS